VSEGLEDGSNNSNGGAVSFNVPDTLTGTLAEDGSGGVDYFKWNATAGVKYQINGTSSGLPQLNLAIDIENGSANILASANANGPGGSESLQFTAPSTATFYLVAWRADTTATGASYSISVGYPAGVNDWDIY
jgi:hypothetical protein